MNNEQLHSKLIQLTTLERKTLSEILELLRLNFKRKVFVKMGYSHLTKYMIRELGYSESAAWRRWSALKITEELPQAKEMLKTGAVNLSTLSKLESHLRKDKKEIKEKALELIQHKTIQETEVGRPPFFRHLFNPSFGGVCHEFQGFK
jgi:Fe2+ transport system protein B